MTTPQPANAQRVGPKRLVRHECCTHRICNARTCMALPTGKTCGNCNHVGRCVALGVTKADRTSCHCYPRRFVEGHDHVPHTMTTKADITKARNEVTVLTDQYLNERGWKYHHDPSTGRGMWHHTYPHIGRVLATKQTALAIESHKGEEG